MFVLVFLMLVGWTWFVEAEFSTILWVSIAGTVLYYFYDKNFSRPANFPPGPPNFPIVGSFPSIKLYNFHFFLEKAREKYGPVIGMKFGFMNVVVFCGPQQVQEAFKKEKFQGRPNITIASSRMKKGVVLTDGGFWRTQRRFTIRHLRDFGFGKTVTENLILDEIGEFFSHKLNDETRIQVSGIFNNSAINVLWAVMAGKRFAHDDTQFLQLLEVLTQTFLNGGFNASIAFFRRVLRSLVGWDEKVECEEILIGFIQETIAEHKRTLTDTPRDFIDAYLLEIAKSSEPDFNEDTLTAICIDLFAAGSESTGNTLSFCVLYLVLYPEWQRELYQEVQEVVGDQALRLDFKLRMPKLEAFYSEVSRINTIAPIAVPRRSMESSSFQGYTIPKNSFLVLSIWSLFHDKEHWGDPEVFRPDRFLKDGLYVKDEWLTAFGIGKRLCPGETLARSIIFLFLVSLIREFKFSLPQDCAPPSTEALGGFTASPKPFQVIIKRRTAM